MKGAGKCYFAFMVKNDSTEMLDKLEARNIRMNCHYCTYDFVAMRLYSIDETSFGLGEDY